MMKPIERFQALLDGKKIRMTMWADHLFIYLSHGELRSENHPMHLMWNKIIDSKADWELYEEPLPEIKLTPEDVGKRVRLRCGQVTVLCLFNPASPVRPYMTFLGHSYYETGCCSIDENDKDIVEVLS